MNAGITLVEVLVAVLVLSIGLLGLATLQMNSLRFATSGHHRSVATMQAYDLIDRMRANSAGVDTGAYDNPSSPSTTAACLTTSGCTATQLAHHDIADWNTHNAQLLPNGAGTVCVDSDPTDGTACDGTGTRYSITVSWSERERSGPATHSFFLTFEP